MKNSFLILISAVSLFLIASIGCSTYPNYNCNKISENQLDTNSITFESVFTSHGQVNAPRQIARIKYHDLYSIDRNIVVEGKIGTHKYPVVLDTGATQPVFLNKEHIKNNNLFVYLIEDNSLNLNGYKLKLCNLPEFHMDQITLTNWICLYLEQRSLLNIFSKPIAASTTRKNHVIIGLPLLSKFKYIIFDNINKEVDFSYHNSFENSENEKWEKYPISIEEDFHGNSFLYVSFPIAGKEIELQLDTGSGRGMAISQSIWKEINMGVEEVKLKKGKDYYPYIGNLPCKKGIVNNLDFANMIIEKAQVSVFPDDSPLLEESEGFIGMQYFEDIIFVLDFEHGFLFLKK